MQDIALPQAYQTLSRLQQNYPQFRDDLEVQQYTMVLEEIFAEHHMKVAKFYFEIRGNQLPARTRWEEVVRKFPNYTQLDAALWYLGQAEESEAEYSNAAKHYQQIAVECADGEYRQKAAERLRQLGYPVANQDADSVRQRRERLLTVAPILLDYNSYFARIPRRGVLIDEWDGVDYELLLLLKKRPDGVDDRTADAADSSR